VTRPTREAYARGHAERDGFEVSVGVEWRADDDIAALSQLVRMVAEDAAEYDDHALALEAAEARILTYWNGRAYFVETEHRGLGVQVYQPFGLPRNA
jgi:hypothetical protein